jgi:transcriptional regulator with XRE-family HTH domain
MVLATGNQLKAARALAGVDQQQVADSAGVNVNTIRNMEARGAKPITSSAVTVRSVQLALEALGIEFLNHSQPGVRLSILANAPHNMAGGSRASAKAVRSKTAKASRTKHK